MRICAISLPELRVELVTGSPAPVSVPVAVVVAPPPMTEAKLLGNTRLSVVSREARALGVLPGQTIAQARARAGDLAVRVVRPNAVHDVLARIAEIGLAFGATVSFSAHAERGASYGDIVWIDVTGCAHLHAPSSIFDGETLLASRLAGVIASLGYTASIAIADGPRIAAMLASASRFRGRRARPEHEPVPMIVKSGENAAAIAHLPVGMLPLAPDVVRWLTKIGVRTIHDLRALPREGLGLRLGAAARDVLTLANGEDRAPLTPYIPPEVPEEEVELEYGVTGAQALTFVAKTLTDRLATRLQGRGRAAGRLELELRLDAAMLEDRSPKTEARSAIVAIDLPAPLSLPGDLLAALRPKIERLVLHAPVLAAKLRAPVLVHHRAFGLSLFEPRPSAERALPRLVAELVSDLGPNAVSSLVLGDSWVPEERSRLVPFVLRPDGTSAQGQLSKKHRQLLSSVPEPTRVEAQPRRISKEDVRITRHLARLEAIDWWRAPPAPRDGGESKRSPLDYVQGWTDEGPALVEIDRATGAMTVRGWFD
jgi:protein ImuB